MGNASSSEDSTVLKESRYSFSCDAIKDTETEITVGTAVFKGFSFTLSIVPDPLYHTEYHTKLLFPNDHGNDRAFVFR